MIPLLEECLVVEVRLGDGSRVFPISPRSPILYEIDAIPQLLSPERAVSKDEIVAALGQHRRVIVGVREDHSVVSFGLPEKVVGRLITQTQKLVKIEPETPLQEMAYPPIRTPLWPVGLLTVLADTPPATIIIPFQYHLQTVAPRTDAWLDIAIQNRLALDWAQVHRGGGTFPRRGKSDCETLSRSIKSENSIWTSMLLGLELSEVTSIRASCLGVGLVRAGIGAHQLQKGTKSLKS